MASAFERPRPPLRLAINEDGTREVEAHKYLQTLYDLPHDTKSSRTQFKPYTSPDRALAAFAQLGALRLGVRRSFISLIDRNHQYVLAEATKTLSYDGGTVGDTEDNLCIGVNQFERRATPCEYAAGLLDVPDTLVVKDYENVTIFPDLSQHELFINHALVNEHPHGRFYAGVPIVSPGGYNIGVFCVLDDTPREAGLATSEVQFLRDMAKTIMGHLEMVRATAELARSQKMLYGLGQLAGDGADPKDWWNDSFQGYSGRSQPKESSGYRSHSVDRSSKSCHQPPGPSSNLVKFPDIRQSPSVARTQSQDIPSSQAHHLSSLGLEGEQKLMEGIEVADKLQENSISPEIKSSFQKAAEVIQQSMDVDGTVFLDASIGSFAGLVGETQQYNDAFTRSSTASSLSWNNTNESSQSADDKCCIVLGNSQIAANNSQALVMAPTRSPSVSEQFLRKLLAKYSRGKVWNFDEHESNTGEEVDSSQTADSMNRGEEIRRERRSIRRLFPGVRSLAFVGLWDPHRGRWYAGSIVWTYNPMRVLSAKSELIYMAAFGRSVVSELARIDVNLANLAKATFINSISHELRTPLHGILGSSECLRGTRLDNSQSSSIDTIEMCGKTLLDTFDNLLSFTKINAGCTSIGHQPASVPSSRSETYRNRVGANNPIDLSTLVEEVVDTAFAGNEFIKTTSMKGRSAISETTPLQPASACSSSGLEAITVLIDYDTTENWVFDTQAGDWTRIILNLVGNSLKYSQRGRVTVRLDSRPLPYLHSENDVEITLTVTDEGRGMSVDFMSQDVFTPFAQEDFMSPGTGLGLSIVKQIVTSMGGTISVKSEKNRGTELAVVVHMKRAEFETKPARPSPVSIVADMLRDKRLNMIVPEGEHDEDGFAEVCSSWCSTPIRCSPEPEEADIYVLTKEHVNAYLGQLTSRSASLSPIGTKPVIVLCKDLLSVHTLQSSRSVVNVSSRMAFMSQPLAPNKIAKTLIQCLELPIRAKSDSASDSKQQISLGTSTPTHLAQACRPDFDIPRERISSNSDAMVLSLTQEKMQRASTVEGMQNMEVNRRGGAQQTQRQASMAQASDVSPAKAISVLLVDDNSINLNLLATFMKKQCHEYDIATNGLEAFQAYQTRSGVTHMPENSALSLPSQQVPPLQARSYDFILMDINMPVMDGLESTRMIRAFELSKRLRPSIIVALTGMSSASAQQEAFASGVDIFLTKPVRLKELRKIFEEHAR